MEVLIILLTIGLLIGGVTVFLRISPSKSRLQISGDEAKFPMVSGFNLNRQELIIPDDLPGKHNLVIVAFQQYQQADVNTWIPYAKEIEARIPGFMYYELPTIYEMPSFSRTFINEGMRAGIPDQTARERTITLYIDKDEFKSALGISSEDEISLFLVDNQGSITWRSSGRFAEAKAKDLEAVLNENQQEK
jgi:hypothetical protein